MIFAGHRGTSAKQISPSAPMAAAALHIPPPRVGASGWRKPCTFIRREPSANRAFTPHTGLENKYGHRQTERCHFPAAGFNSLPKRAAIHRAASVNPIALLWRSARQPPTVDATCSISAILPQRSASF
ncbi:hypothetical protein KCP73_06210 [Salmonella enterica subsp. enterica]|nr:hypothetical protein KCP73_06210 [Salmonella enterica subsp. enterica]